MPTVIVVTLRSIRPAADPDPRKRLTIDVEVEFDRKRGQALEQINFENNASVPLNRHKAEPVQVESVSGHLRQDVPLRLEHIQQRAKCSCSGPRSWDFVESDHIAWR